MIAVSIVCNHCGVRATDDLKYAHLMRKQLKKIGWKHVEAKGIDLCEKCADICELDHTGIRCEVERVRRVFQYDMSLLQKACGVIGHKWKESDESIHCEECGALRRLHRDEIRLEINVEKYLKKCSELEDELAALKKDARRLAESCRTSIMTGVPCYSVDAIDRILEATKE